MKEESIVSKNGSPLTSLQVVLSLLTLLLVQAGALAPFGLMDVSSQLSLFFIDRRVLDDQFFILLVCFFHGFGVLVISYSVFRLFRRSGSIVLFILLLLYALLLLVEAFYQAKFAIPLPYEVVNDLVAAPNTFLDYTRSGLAQKDILIFGSLLALCTACLWVAICPLRNAFVPFRVLWLWSLLWLGGVVAGEWMLLQKGIPYYLLRAKGSPPVYRWYSSLFYKSNDTEFRQMADYLPSWKETEPLTLEVAPRHVLLMVAECLRADHLPQYGYPRNTTPFLLNNREEWIPFWSFYSHAPLTRYSFPTIFSGYYFLEPQKIPSRTEQFWKLLRANGIDSAFISAGALSWGNLDSLLSLHSTDYSFHASRLRDWPKEKSASLLRYEYAIDDTEIVKLYLRFIDSLAPQSRSFAALHFVSSHYPFSHDKSHNLFSNLRFAGEVLPESRLESSSAKREIKSYSGPVKLVSERRIQSDIDAFDDSVVYVDHLVSTVIGALRERRLLDDTLVLLTSDHGDAWGEHGTIFHGTTLFEEQVHIPLLVRPGMNLKQLQRPLRRASESLFGLVDIVPTVLNCFGIPRPRDLHGCSMLSGCVKPYELLLYNGLVKVIGVLKARWKFLFDLDLLRAYQFDLQADHGELSNLWRQPVTSLAEFLASLEEHGIVHNRSRKAVTTTRLGMLSPSASRAQNQRNCHQAPALTNLLSKAGAAGEPICFMQR